MTRNQKNIKPGMDQLERREVLSSGGPSDQAQYMLELINEARTNPSAAAQRAATTDLAELNMTMDYYGESISAATSAIASAQPKQPLAWNDKLAAAATMQSQYQANTGQQTHSGPNGMDLNRRMAANGYDGEVISTENAYAYADSVDHAMQAFLMDWGVADKGHRRNIQQNNVGRDQSFNEVGVGIVSTSNRNLGPLVVTQNFARSSKNPTPKLVGVIYTDYNRNNFYTPGEGVDMVQIRAQNLTTGEVSTVNNWDSGGYQMDLSPGRYRVSARRGLKALGVQDVTIGNENVKIDFVADLESAPTINETQTTPVATPKAVQGRSMPLSSVKALANSTRFDLTSIRNWSAWKARG